ncbi:MFS transporter [Candidatus Berkiella aquae]|uniref:Lysosomal dipeptide transporter MFSD1 n=1 Tax=Candidatus Berkiella aquae TaxID=295108 RepID=A0A0Q9YLS6_9GAMM|nr:MFS transporter [Candidatus Berkiella aquae]MCS5711614.1 MFS transporter [Candidatus Berkiella aquae]
MNTTTRKSLHIYYIAWLAIAGFYLYQYILRVSPGIMVVELRHAFKLTAEQFSSLGSIYLFSYSLLQIPLGFILDRIGVRKVVMMSIILCILGTLIFSFATHLWMLQLGRFLIGLGSAPAFICALKLVNDHLPEKYSGLFMGMTLSLGTLGALLSGKCMVTILELNGWQHSLNLCAAFGLVILVLAFIAIPKQTTVVDVQTNNLNQLRQGLSDIFKSREIIIYSIVAVSVYTPLCVLADLWGTAFLMEKYALSRAVSAELSLYLYGGLTVGSLLLPWLSMRWNKSKETILFCAMGIMISLFFLLYANNLHLWQLSMILTSIGVFCAAEMICFASAVQFSPKRHSGLTLGVVNTLNMLGGAIIQQFIGWYLDVKWNGEYGQSGERLYSADDLSAAFTFLIIIIFACNLLFLKLPKGKAITAQAIK